MGYMKIQFAHKFNDIICVNNLFLAWQEFIVGKRSKKDVQEFSRHLIDNILSLHESLKNKAYRHGGYRSFYINDPKRRHIHKAGVRDRLLHHAIYRLLYPFFERIFIYDSYSCRLGKGTHKAIKRFDDMSLKASQNNTKMAWVLKCDIRKFFDSIDHGVLQNILSQYIPDEDILWLLGDVIGSYHNVRRKDAGLPLGNLTSQLFANVYMNKFDQWIMHGLKAGKYIRYADDFVFFGADKQWLSSLVEPIKAFLQDELKLTIHPNKIILTKLFSGVDFLGWRHFPHYKNLRKKTRGRMFRRLADRPENAVYQSYIGLLKYGNTYKIERDLRNLFWLLK